MSSDDLRFFSFGAGWQSTAALALAARGEIPYRRFIFANVGDDSEHPGTLRYIAEHARPFADRHGIELTEVRRTRRDGSTETLYGRLTREGSPSMPIPVRLSNGAPGTRSCTADFKIKTIGRELKRRGTSRDNPATAGIGISVDEIHRANRHRAEPDEDIDYPLLTLGIRRTDWAASAAQADLGKIICIADHDLPANWATFHSTRSHANPSPSYRRIAFALSSQTPSSICSKPSSPKPASSAFVNIAAPYPLPRASGATRTRPSRPLAFAASIRNETWPTTWSLVGSKAIQLWRSGVADSAAYSASWPSSNGQLKLWPDQFHSSTGPSIHTTSCRQSEAMKSRISTMGNPSMQKHCHGPDPTEPLAKHPSGGTRTRYDIGFQISCPFHRTTAWADMRREEPDLFARACSLEALLNERRATLGRDPVYLTRFNRPLDKAIPAGVDVLPLSDDADCDTGWCMT